MKFCVVFSNKDLAGINIAKELRKIDKEVTIIEKDKEIIFLDEVDKELDFDFIIFASKHQSCKKVKSLTVHPIGNWKTADFGGKAGKICPSIARINKKMFQILNKNSSQINDFIVSMECTHHGPYIEKPSLFIEIGSSEEEWENPEFGKVIAKTIKEFVNEETKNKEQEKKEIIAIGIGGPHYCNNFNEIQLNSKISLSHIIPEYVLPINEKIINEVLKKTLGKTKYFIVDWKGIGNSESKKNLLELLNKIGKENNIKTIKTREAKQFN